MCMLFCEKEVWYVSETYDVVVLGGGTGGYVAAIRGAQLGLKVAIIEADKLGGTCLHQGCIPSKALLRSAEVLVSARNSEFGVVASDVQFDLQKAMARKQQVVAQLHKGVQFLMKKHEITVIHGFGRIMGPSIFSPSSGAVRIEHFDGESEIISPRHTVIATGSRPRELPDLPFDKSWVISSQEALELNELPSSLLIVGAGAIGTEWASMMADFGVQVTLIESLPRILAQEDEEVSLELTRSLKKRHVRVLTDTIVDPSSVQEKDGRRYIDMVTNGQRQTLQVDLILVAIGRTANTDNIGLEATGVVVQNGAIVVNEMMQTAEKSIYAIGDVIGGLQLAHVASHEGIVAMEAIAGLAPDPINYLAVARCTYSRPEVASVGITESEAQKQGRKVKTSKFFFRANGKALVYGEPEGFVKIVADEVTDDLLGVHMVGPHVTDLISEAALATFLDATPWELGQMIHPHPTLSEALGEAALMADERGIHG